MTTAAESVRDIFQTLVDDPDLDRRRALAIVAELAEEFRVDVVAVLADAVEKAIAEARTQAAEKAGAEEAEKLKPKRGPGRPSEKADRDSSVKACTDFEPRILALPPAERRAAALRFVAALQTDETLPERISSLARDALKIEKRRDRLDVSGERFRREKDDEAFFQLAKRWFPILKYCRPPRAPKPKLKRRTTALRPRRDVTTIRRS